MSVANIAPSPVAPREPDAESGHRPAAGEAPAINAKLLLEMIVTDLHWTSLQIASLCLMTAACARPGSTLNLRSCRHLAYEQTSAMLLALRYSHEIGLGEEVKRRLEGLCKDYAEAQAKITPFVDAATLSAMQRGQLSKVQSMLGKTALAAAAALGLIEPVLRARLAPDYLADNATAREFLARAGRGDAMAIDRFGVLTLPKFKQRRRSPRAPANRPCRILFSGGEAEAMLLDVSRDGLGLLCKTALTESQPVTVFIDGRRLEAAVARREGERLGVTLKQPLGFTDPLFLAD